jgi:hypothetical protein
MDDDNPGELRPDFKVSDSRSTEAPRGSAGNGSVGYRRPPTETRFKPGQSGNPSGRPKGKRSVGAILHDVMNRNISVTENGKTRKVSAIEAMLHRLRSDALRGDKAAVKQLLPLYERYADAAEGALQTEDLLREDMDILAKYGMFGQGTEENASPDGDVGSSAVARDEVDE